MAKIFITGNAGSGKSTLGKRLANDLGLQVHGLDKIVWQEGWRKTPREERRKLIKKLISKPSWVIEGVDDDILRAADTIIFLDIPRRICFYQAAKRNWRYLFSSRPDAPPNCPEIQIIPTLIKIIWLFPSRVRPQIMKFNAKSADRKFIHIKTREQARSISSQTLSV